jgi:cytoskeletal protein RodZ
MSITIGQRLKKAREERYLTLEKASEETRIRIVLLQALESDDYSVMPSSAQGRGFLRNYAEYLNLNIDEMIADFQKSPPPTEEMSGPLQQVSLVETEIPPLTAAQEEKKSPPFWSSWFARRQQTESTPQGGSVAPIQEVTAVPVPEIEVELPKPRAHRKKKVEEEIPATPAVESASAAEETIPIKDEKKNLSIAAEQIEVQNEAQPGLIAWLTSLFRIRLNKSDSAIEEMDEVPFEPKPKPKMPSDSASVIFAEIGRKLRERRELISLTIDEVERHTHLRAALIKAMEEGAFDKLPSTVQTRGILANYAAFLDLDADTILLRFADAVQARHREKYAQTPRERIQTEVATSMPVLRSFIAGDLIFGVVMITLILALSVWGIGRVLNLRDNNPARATAPSIVEVLAGTPLPTPSVEVTFVPVNDAPLATGAPDQATLAASTLGANANVVINIFAVERAFLRVSVDGKVVFEGRMSPRETQMYEAENQVEVLTGNAAALRITYNGRDLGLMGNIGEVVSRVYTIAGVVTPTSTLPPTPTETRPTTSTPTPTVTRTPTLTITAKP